MSEWFQEGGLIMWLLLVISLISWGVIFERGYVLWRETRISLRLKRDLDNKGYGEREVEDEAPRFAGVLAVVLHTVIVNRRLAREDNVLLAKTRLNEEVGHLERGLTLLEVAASISPLLGLLGTVLGMVEVFSVIAVVGVGDPSVLSSGIAKALNTTVFGLITAIPALAAFSFFDRRIDRQVHLIESCTTLVLADLYAESNEKEA